MQVPPKHQPPKHQPPFLLTLAPLRVQNPETSRLLHDDPYRSQYGTDQNRRRAQDEPDPTEMTPQEREAQQRICHAMSEYVTYLCSGSAS